MGERPWWGAAMAGALGAAAVLSLPVASAAQTPAVKPLGQPCNKLDDLANTNPPQLRAVDETLLTSGLPCAETVHPEGPPGKTRLENFQRGFDFYSWLTFIALNAPADESEIKNARPDTRTKWEDMRHFRQLADIMLPGGKPPQWGERRPQEVPAACRNEYKPEMMVTQLIEESFNQPFKTGPLVDQNGNYALFDILLNRQMFDYIVKNKLYSKKEQMRNSALKIDFPAGTNPPTGQTVGGDPGTVMVKVSWKVLDSDKDKERFHNVDALIFIPASEDGKTKEACVRKTLGLIGFHVGHKTKNRLQWIWTSFEHVDNVPEQKEVDARSIKTSYNFYDPACDAEKCPVNATPPRPWRFPDRSLKFPGGFKSQITRVTPLTEDTKEINAKFQNILRGTVWANYMLLSTQWPSDFGCSTKTVQNPVPDLPPNTDFDKQPDMNCAPAPAFLANSTLETYSQGSVPQASSSCMACHGNAVSYQRRPPNVPPDAKFFNQSDFTFTLEKARD